MNALNQLVFKNPMLIDARRFNRRFLGVGKGKGVSIAVIVGCFLLYGLLISVTVAYRQDLDPTLAIHLQTGLFCIVIVSVMQGSIAGEREKRTWDILMTAPVSGAQVVIGKFLMGVFVVLMIALFFAVPVAIPAIAQGKTWMIRAFHGEVISLMFGVCLTSVALFVSSRSRRSFSALASTFGLMILGLIVYPGLVALTTTDNPVLAEYLYSVHPFIAIDRASKGAIWVGNLSPDFSISAQQNLGWLAYGAVQTVVYLVVAVTCLALAANSMFLPEGVRKMKKRLKSA